MRKIAFLSLIFFLLVTQSLAVEIKGEVLNLEGKPVVEAVVLHRQSRNKALTDEKGLLPLQFQTKKRSGLNSFIQIT